MHSEHDIARNDDAGGDIAVLDRPEPSAEVELNAPSASAETKCDRREVRQAIGAIFVRAWAMRRCR